ncbi:MAG: ATP-binding protein, partial [Anaerolineales bacterium]
TPLTGILGIAESLQLGTYGQLNEKQSSILNSIETSGRHLLELINDILDLSKVEAGKFDIYPEMIDIEETCRASLLFVKEQAAKKSILLEYQDTKYAKSVFADSRRLKQMLVNLLSNAVKFTPEKGQVNLIVHADSEKQQIHFTITDTGIGIAQDDLKHLFTPFTQVDSRLNRQYEGTGLGLVLVLRLAEMHGGNVQVESQVGTGSSFTISLPWHTEVIPSTQPSTVQTSAQPAIVSEPNSRGILLLVEDSPTNVETIGDYLQFKGYSVVVASNGMEALIKAEEVNPQLILMDIQMPVMDGLEATRRLRADSRFATTPIIALTALAMAGDREQCLSAGANDYLSKPVSLKELVGKIDKLLQKT